MLVCNLCQKGMHMLAFSRHRKGRSGAGGTWALRAPITKKVQRPNLHSYQGMKFCTKCLRAVKTENKVKKETVEAPQVAA